MTTGIITVFGMFCIWFGLTGRGSKLLGQTILTQIAGGQKPAAKSTNAPAAPRTTNA